MKHHERRNRERQELKQKILHAARELALRDGWQAVTIRKIAERVEYSPPAIYEYFESKEVILLELMREGFRAVLTSLQNANQADADPLARFVAMGKAYWRFAWQNPELYQVMHSLGGVPFGTAEAPLEAKEVFAFVKDRARETRQALGVRGPVTDEMIEIVWATLHGLVSLSMSGRIPTKKWSDKYPLVEQAVRNLVRGWSK